MVFDMELSTMCDYACVKLCAVCIHYVYIYSMHKYVLFEHIESISVRL